MPRSVTELAYIDEAGFHLADFEDFLAFNQDAFRQIYGQDVNLDADTQDGQWVTHIAQTQYDIASLCAATFNRFSPSTAEGDALRRQIKINGIKANPATHSTVDVVIVGTEGTVITNGKVRDSADNSWSLPASVTIPASGQITVTATADEDGPIEAAAGAVSRIGTPTDGWISVSNPSIAVPGKDAQSDAELRILQTNSTAQPSRIGTPTDGWISVSNPSIAVPGKDAQSDAELRILQTNSTAQPSQSILQGIQGELLSLDGVTRLRMYENDTSETDDNGIPSHSISAVVEGGDSNAIAEVIRRRKTAGTGTYGTTSIVLTDSAMMPITIKFFRPTTVSVKVKVTIDPLVGYASTYAEELKQQVCDYINSLGIGSTLYLSKLYVPANLENNTNDSTYDIVSIETAEGEGDFSAQNITTEFNEVLQCDIEDIEVVTQ